MKKHLFILFALLILALPARAQFHLSLAPVTGLNFNIGTGSDVEESTNGFGFLVGAKVDMNFTPTIGLMTNVLFYDSRGVSSSTQGTTGGISYTLDASSSIAYLEIEPLFKINVPNSMFYFFAGPSVGFNIESTLQVKLSSAGDQLTFQDGSKKYKATMRDMNTRFELKLGSGIDISLGNNIDISPEVSFGYGITKVKSDVEWRILTIQAMVGVKFRLI